mmetsp:Transcript_23562/g.54802  ORF Transcript_23562/g.54802 Transcript_23562/m.54802 type:complete len:144 (-) Transcript_23562:109-540(-)
MRGTLPSELGLLGALITLDVSSNHFHGTLAPEFVGWRSMEYLDLNGNMFTGSPSVLTKLPRLREFWTEYRLGCVVRSDIIVLRACFSFAGTLFIDGTDFDDLGGLCDVPFDWEVFVANACFAFDRYDCSCCNECCIATGCMPL